MLNEKKFQEDLLSEYQKLYPSKEDALIEPFITKICSRMVTLAFKLYEKEHTK